MYPISSTVKGLFDNNQRQIIEITMDTTDNEQYTLTESDIISGSFSVDRYCITGNQIEIGTAAAGECKFRIKDYEGDWNNVTFEGAQLYVRIGIADWENYEDANDINWIPVGYFVIDQPVSSSHIKEIVALDRMAKFDRPVDWTNFSSSYTPVSLINALCTICGVVLNNGASLSSLPNAAYTVTLPTDNENLTYRNLLQSACMLLGACAYFNWQGQLYIAWYETASVGGTTLSIDESKRYNHTIAENDIQISGVYFHRDTTSGTAEVYLSGTNDYAINISDNVLIPDGDSTNTPGVVTALGTALTGFTYRPVKAGIKPSPYLYPLDKYNFVKGGTTYTGIVSNVTFGLNATTAIEGRGKTAEEKGYATYGTLTGVQSKIVEYAKEKAAQAVTEYEAQLINLNEMITNAVGLYVITVPISGGGTQYYYADASTLADATIIYTFGSNGFAWTTDWNDGNPVWQYGLTSTGNAVLNILSAYKISADYISAGTMSAVNLIFGQTPNTTELKTNQAKTGALFEGSGVMQFKTKGEFFAENKDANNNTVNSIQMTYFTNGINMYLTNRQHSNPTYKANEINLQSLYTNSLVSDQLRLSNYQSGYNNVLSNELTLSSYNGSNTMAITNYASGSSNWANRIDITSTSSNHSMSLTNYQLNSATEGNKINLGIGTSGSSFTVTNKDSSNVNANKIEMTTISGERSVVIRNYNTSGTERSSFGMHTDGSMLLRTNTGGSSWLSFDKSGNVTLQANNSLNIVSQNYRVVVNTAGESHEVVWGTVSGVRCLIAGS